MTSPAFAAHRAAASGLFTLTSLLVIALGSADPRAVAAAIAVSLVSLWLFTREAVRDGLGSFAAPLAMLVDQAVLVAAIALTEGARSPYALLFPAGLALAWALEGRAAARFFAAVSLLAVGALALLGIVSLEDAATRVPLAAMALAAPALLAALEAGAGRPASEGRAAAPVPARKTAEARDQDAGILHDLRSPLSVMRVYADLIAEGARRGQLPNPEHLSNLKREIELAEGLVGGPVGSPERAGEQSEREPQNRSPGPAAAVQPAGPPPIADLVEILGSLATAYRLSLAGNRRIEFIAERPQLPVTAEPVALQRAFRNVIENAIKYTAEGGEIRIRAGAAGPHAFVVVKDTGIGMSPEERQRAFDYAFRGSGAVASGKPGKGLGLALTKEILEANGGRISLSSEAGFGSEVTILLPYQRGPRV